MDKMVYLIDLFFFFYCNYVACTKLTLVSILSGRLLESDIFACIRSQYITRNGKT